MYIAFISAHFRDLIYRDICCCKQKLGVLNSAVNDFVHGTYAEYLFVGMFKVGSAHRKPMGEIVYIPPVLRHIVDLRTQY